MAGIYTGKTDGEGWEKFAHSEYVIKEKSPSHYVLGATQSRVVGTRCPRCGQTCEALDHFEHTTCSRCSLIMVVHGNCLAITGPAWQPTPEPS